MKTKYSTYKSSGVEWIGEIPKDWVVKRIGFVSELLTGFPWKSDLFDFNEGLKIVRGENVSEGFLRWGERTRFWKQPVEENSIYFLSENDIVVSMDGSKVGKNYVRITQRDLPLLLHQRMCRIRIMEGCSSRFLSYFIGSEMFRYHIDISKTDPMIPHITEKDIFNFKFTLPPLPEQEQIVKYLDEKTSQIDGLISITEKKIELLKQKRTSLINEVVTKGLNPDVELKDSGVEWIGEIPRHWEISKFKYDTIKPVQYGLNISGEKYKEEGIRFIRITDLTEEGSLILEDGKYLEESEVPTEFLLSKYDVLFCRSGHTVGKSYLHIEDGKYTSGGYLVRFNFGNLIQSKYIFYLTKTNFYWDWIKLNTIVSTIENVNGDKYQNFFYPKPPIEEQEQIVEYIDTHTSEIDKLVSIEKRRIETLKEYRQSLISEVVTGKIKVTE